MFIFSDRRNTKNWPKIVKIFFTLGIYLQHGGTEKLKGVPRLWWDVATIYLGFEANF